MFATPVNYFAVIISSILAMGLGFLWYSPVLFGTPWMRLMGFTKQSLKKSKKNMGPMYALSFVATILTVWILAVVMNLVILSTLGEALELAFFLWLGFEATVMLTEVIFGGKKWGLYAINAGYQLAVVLIAATTLLLLG